MAGMNCSVVTPEATVLEEKVDFVVLPLYDGEIGIGAGHSPMIGRMGYGEMRLKSGSKVSRYYVDGGIVQVERDEITILTGSAVPASQLDAESARARLAQAKAQKASNPESAALRQRAIDQARGQLRVVAKN